MSQRGFYEEQTDAVCHYEKRIEFLPVALMVVFGALLDCLSKIWRLPSFNTAHFFPLLLENLTAFPLSEK